MTREEIIKEWESVLSRDPLDAPWDLIDDTLTLLKEQEDEIAKFCGEVARLTAMLKEQEEVEPKHNPLSPTDWFCGKCGMCISRFHNYCPSCGQEVRWE